MIPDDQVEEVRARADIVDIIGELVPLKKAGREYKANCPFHEERTPSFYVVPEKGFYTCFGCHKSGDVFSFVMEKMGLDFVEAVKHVAARSGIEIREVSRQREEDDPHRAHYELNGFAHKWFRDQLLDPATGSAAMAYLEGRGISADVAERFGLGWAPDEWRGLRDAAGKHGFDEALMMEVGLLATSERSTEPYDRFRGRIIFPIEALSGKVVAFGGRVIESGGKAGAKYLNSPESPIYHKGKMLYGLSWARHTIRREESVLVVEGYMDVVSLAAHGFENVVAPLGTALTPEQAKLMGRYAQRILLLFDSDHAGLRATFKAGDLLLEEGLHPSVVTMPPGEDPDTLVRGEGAEALRGYLDDAVDVLDRKLQILEERDFFSSIERTREAVDRLLPTVRAATDPALRDIYVKKVSDRTGVRRETLEAELLKQPSGPQRPRQEAPQPGRAAPLVPKMNAERTLLLLMIRNATYVDSAAEWLSPSDFDDSSYRAIFEALLDDPELRSAPPGMDVVARQRFEELLGSPFDTAGAREEFTAALNRIRAVALDRRMLEIQQRIVAAETDEEKAPLVVEKQRLASELRAIDPEYYWKATAQRRWADPNSNRQDR